MAARVAPTLKRIVLRESGWLRDIQGHVAREELAALLERNRRLEAVARAARRVDKGGSCPASEDCAPCKLTRAIDRLDRAGGRNP